MEEGHSYGPTCALYESDDDHPVADGLTPPKVKAQFFYASPLPIDDPLSPLPPITAEQVGNQPPQPFSSRDNAALEEAWQGYHRRQEEFKARPGSRGLHRMFSFPKFQSGQVLTPELTSPVAESSGFAFPTVPDFRSQSRNSVSRRKSSRKASSRSHSPIMTRKQSDRNAKLSITSESEVMLDQSDAQENGISRRNTVDEIAEELDFGSVKRKKHRSPMREQRRRNDDDVSPPVEQAIPEHEEMPTSERAPVPPHIAVSEESAMSGRPFARAPSTRQLMGRLNASSPLASPRADKSQIKIMTPQRPTSPPNEERRKTFVPVGVSRLHLVEFPDLAMKPIYWSPINDTSHVLRATWFYKDSMLPVPADVANRLELGYEDMKPYSATYQDELNACIEHGAAAELKIVYKLWPDEKKTTSRPGTGLPDKMDGSTEIEEEQLPSIGDNIAVDPRKRDKDRRLFQSHSVVYTDSRNAQILRPSALPSVSRNRKPLSALRKGRQLGVAVVRGFSRQAWQKLHPDRAKGAKAAHAKAGAEMSQSGDATTRSRRMSCHVCDDQSSTPKVSDLVLVIHGIGQKLSERVDSFHFTHAINGLRREFNVQLSQENVRGSMKHDAGIMVLPVNWRLTVSFDEDYKPREAEAENKYELKDITPETLPAIRSMISDVMLDIPYYMSHHKQKMISAVVREANRVYRLWCRNNPGFEEYGRVHLVAHSLGSAMAMDILSQQPTTIPRDIEMTTGVPSDTIFEFNTTNLFCCGSPSGFFLLLNGANLIPRKGRHKPGMELEDRGPGVACEEERYGCLAVDNMYNIMHKNDPIAYQQNAAVDSQYASMLQPATIPSASQSLYQRLSGSLRFSGTAVAPDAYGYITRPTRPGVSQMPSTVELETHNFTREEIAEKRMFLLNDNGQIDYFLQSGGGPLEIQYLNMLSAHSSYWILQDFVRFLVVEIGRKPGRENTLPLLRAVKKVNYKRGEGL
ncbi:hypothetical protein PMZ80_001727 [Knufia obscura]|uniref:DDHD domain-containing protein n=2 Tax=Knufia TaxID=430999 RepID=A0AAN8ENN8_9EURO|nr:hypothetical protein PMZ80_001727 [Knufia obscura]KAK5955448.1 hypothetical protein OHC33_003086 [Knufia fluminis]